MRRLMLMLVVVFMMVLSCNIAFAGAQDFTLVNNTGSTIFEVYVSPTYVNEWQEDVLDADTLKNGDSVKITFSRRERASFWDIKVVFEDDSNSEWLGFNLKEISTITLKRNGQAIYN